MTERKYGCYGCVNFGGLIWMGDVAYVTCPLLSGEIGLLQTGAGAERIDPSRGCGLREPADGAGSGQKMLF